MPTVLDIVTRAFRKARIGGMGEVLDEEMSSEGLDALNGMLHEWKLRGVDLSHTDVELTDAFPLDPEYQDGATHMLAARISPDYARPRDFDADDFFRAIQAAYMTIEEITLPDGLADLPSSNGYRYDAS